jgi:hypothetical protein
MGRKEDAIIDYTMYLKQNPDAESVRQRMNMLIKDSK